ncbi:MAG: hypothetical protein NUV97_03560 [archaeon]|nr:hypothetical protein [archaeon]MCR4323905.1 hypothetical protein [Nanoarchaeota archaeon]
MAERKKYIEVEIPLISDSVRVLGTFENLKDKTIKLDLTRRMRGKGLTITFKIFQNEKKLVAIPKKMELVKAYIRRVMRKRTDYVEDSFLAHCSDIQTIVKPLLITRKKVSRVVRKNLRNTCKEFLLEYLKERSYNEICYELLEGSLQKTLLPKLKKIYPLSFCDLRIFETKELEKVDIQKEVNMGKKGEIEIPQEDTEENPEEVEEEKEEVEEEKEEKPKKSKVKKNQKEDD